MVTIQYKKIIIITLSTIVLMSLGVTEAIALTTGFDGVSAYRRTGGCFYEDRAGVEYVTNLRNALVNSGYFANSFTWTNNDAWESDLRSYAPTVDFFAFSGHGFRYNSYYTLRNEASLHFYTINSSTPPFHTQENDDRANATWSELSFNGQPLKWITTHTCNFLTNGGSLENYNKIGRMMRGANLIHGFASTMWLDSREGWIYGSYIGNGNTFREAFFEAAFLCQTGKGFTITARVFGWVLAENDRHYSYHTGAPSFESSSSSFTTWNRDIN